MTHPRTFTAGGGKAQRSGTSAALGITPPLREAIIEGDGQALIQSATLCFTAAGQ